MTNIKLTAIQSRVHNSPARNKVWVAGRRSGKSFLGVIEAFYAACADLNQVIWILAPTWKMGKQIYWNALKQLIPRSLMLNTPNESDLMITLRNGSVISIRAAHNPNSLIGQSLDYLIIDEVDTYNDPQTTWELLRPALADREGKTLMISTPRGYGFLHEMFYQGSPGYIPTSDELKNPHYINPLLQWESFQSTTLQGGQVSREEINLARMNMSDKIFDQEFNACFTSLSGLVYSSYDEVHNLDDTIKYNPDKPILIALDFNLNPMSACLMQAHSVKRNGERKLELAIFDEIVIQDSNTFEMCQEIKTRFPDKRVIVYPDASGSAGKTSSNTHTTDHSIIEDHGFTIQADPSNGYVSDRINNVQRGFKSKSGERSIFIHPHCRELRKGLNGLVYKKGTTVPDKSLGIEHLTDALGYAVNQIMPIQTVGSTSVNMGLG